MTLLELLSHQPFSINITSYYFVSTRIRGRVDVRIDTWLSDYYSTRQLRNL